MSMDDVEIEKLAEKVIEKMEAKNKSFLIDPEKHYQQHEDLKDLIEIYKTARNGIIKFLLSMFILGIFAVGIFWKFGGKT